MRLQENNGHSVTCHILRYICVLWNLRPDIDYVVYVQQRIKHSTNRPTCVSPVAVAVYPLLGLFSFAVNLWIIHGQTSMYCVHGLYSISDLVILLWWLTKIHKHLQKLYLEGRIYIHVNWCYSKAGIRRRVARLVLRHNWRHWQGIVFKRAV